MICAFQQFGSVFCRKSRKASTECDCQRESSDHATYSSDEQDRTIAMAPTESIIIDVSDEEKETLLKRKEPQTDETEEDPDELFLPQLKKIKQDRILDDDDDSVL